MCIITKNKFKSIGFVVFEIWLVTVWKSYFWIFFLQCFFCNQWIFQNDKLSDVLINLNWYLLPISMQKDFRLMLLRAQKSSKLIAGTVPINLDTFVNVRLEINTYICYIYNYLDFFYSVLKRCTQLEWFCLNQYTKLSRWFRCCLTRMRNIIWMTCIRIWFRLFHVLYSLPSDWPFFFMNIND